MCYNCHCTIPDEYIEKISKASKKNLYELALLYCKIWKEPPWNERFWTPEKVLEDLVIQMAKPGAIGYIAINDYIIENPKVTGFTWGYKVNIADLQRISGSSEREWVEITGAKKTFYLDELGVDKDYRRHGTGINLTQKLLEQMPNLRISRVILRTDVKAVAARSLYKKLGFKEIPITDAEYHDRTYWLLSL